MHRFCIFSLFGFDLSMLRGQLNKSTSSKKIESFINKAKNGSSQMCGFGKQKLRKNVEKKFHVTLNLLEISPSLQRISILLAQKKNSLAAPTVMENKRTQPKYHWSYNDCKI